MSNGWYNMHNTNFFAYTLLFTSTKIGFYNINAPRVFFVVIRFWVHDLEEVSEMMKFAQIQVIYHKNDQLCKK